MHDLFTNGERNVEKTSMKILRFHVVSYTTFHYKCNVEGSRKAAT